MKFSEYLAESQSQNDIDAFLAREWRRYEGEPETHRGGTFDPDIIVNYVNRFKPPNLKAQEFVYNHLYEAGMLDLRNVQQPLLNVILKDPAAYKDDESYEDFVRANYPHDELLANKWIRYGEAMRNKE